VGVLKNAPHKASTKVWVNWLLSKEGQETYVTGWVQHNQTSAVSLHKDVAPVKQRFVSELDYKNMDSMLITSTAGADSYISRAQHLYREISRAPSR